MLRALFPVALMLAAPAAATVKLVDPIHGPPGSGRFVPVTAGSGGTYGIELRGGDSGGAANWEVGVGSRTSVPGFFSQGNLDWGCTTTNANAAANLGCGTVLPFSLTWTPTALSFTIGAVTVSSPVTLGAGLAALQGDSLRIWAKRDASFTVTSVDGVAFNLGGTGVASGAPVSGADFVFHSLDNWAGQATMTGTIRIAGGRGSTNQVFISNGNFVPEPASWAMLIAGFGLTGAVMRRRRRVAA